MRTYKTVERTVPATMTCDLCGATGSVESECAWPGPSLTWVDSQWGERSEITVRIEVESLEEDDRMRRTTRESWDICPRCFDAKIRPLLPPGNFSVL